MELWDLYTANRTLTGKQIERGKQLPKATYHLVIHFWAVNMNNEYLIQQRSQKVEKGKGLWAITGGSVTTGENSQQGLIREIEEELGLQLTFNSDFQLWDSYLHSDCIFDIWVLKWTEKYHSQNIIPGEEVSHYKWVSKETILEMIDKGLFHDYKQKYFDSIFKFRW